MTLSPIIGRPENAECFVCGKLGSDGSTTDWFRVLTALNGEVDFCQRCVMIMASNFLVSVALTDPSMSGSDVQTVARAFGVSLDLSKWANPSSSTMAPSSGTSPAGSGRDVQSTVTRP